MSGPEILLAQLVQLRADRAEAYRMVQEANDDVRTLIAERDALRIDLRDTIAERNAVEEQRDALARAYDKLRAQLDSMTTEKRNVNAWNGDEFGPVRQKRLVGPWVEVTD